MASSSGFKFNFILDDGEEKNGPQHAQRSRSSQSASNAPSCSSTLTKSSPDCSLSSHPQSCQQSVSYKLSELEVVVRSFHEHLLTSLSPLTYSVTLQLPLPPPSLPPSPSLTSKSQEVVTLHYVTSDQLQALQTTQETLKQDSNLKSGTKASSVIAQLGAELGHLVSITDSAHSDLIPGVYEGGMKIWECAYDLIDYLATEHRAVRPLSGCRVMELGCGIGLPGIFALLGGAECVHFHDYNHEVLSCLTIPSVLASLISGQPNLTTGQTGESRMAVAMEIAASKTKFYFGDWTDFASCHAASGALPYDIILTSETIYSVQSQQKLLRALKKLTNQSGGLVVMAAKTHYFGVGGSVSTFRNLVDKDGHFETVIARSITASVPRVILLLKLKAN